MSHCHYSLQGERTSVSYWYVLSILSTIFCCLPCGIVGLVHVMIAKQDGDKADMASYRRKMRQARCWTIWSIILGLLVIVLIVVYCVYVYNMMMSAMAEIQQAYAPQLTGQRMMMSHGN
mgnify:CR=1 FL=1